MKGIEIPIWKKMNLTIDEASIYSGIGVHRLRELTDRPDCPFVLYKGTHKMIKRKEFEEYNSKLKVL
ncbi:MAG: transposase [Streptococcaceae bacterium]|jgi:hypothetical protein|nr:transposase [Streptococcaceae bacterium]